MEIKYRFNAAETKQLLRKWRVDCRLSLPTAKKKLRLSRAGCVAEIEKLPRKNIFIVVIKTA